MYIILTGAHSPHGECGHVHCAEGDMRVYGIAVLSFFPSGISVILILKMRYAVFHPFRLQYSAKEDRSQYISTIQFHSPV